MISHSLCGVTGPASKLWIFDIKAGFASQKVD
jgi:hypothetical protein